VKDHKEYLQGGVDCKSGVIPTEGHTEDYYQGYSDQYTVEQNLTYGSEQVEHCRIRRN
jgi:hypothetical protein